MALTCTRCEGTGFLNYEQLPENIGERMEAWETKEWVNGADNAGDATVCDCCGDGEDWHGEPGEHYNSDDPQGMNGLYAYNGGLAECH